MDLSIIIPVYNGEKYIQDCIDSILADILLDAEIIVVNDGLTDSTLQILEQYGEKIILINQCNQGVSGARNNALDVARGRYILFVDADDTVDAFELRKVISKCNGEDIISFGYSIDFYDTSNELIDSCKRVPPYLSLKYTDDVYNTLFTSIIGIGKHDLERWTEEGKLKEGKLQGFTWCYLFRNELIQSKGVRFNREIKYNEDAIFNADVFRCAKDVAFFEDIVYHYIKRKGKGASYQIAHSNCIMAENKLRLLQAKEGIYFDELAKNRGCLDLLCGSNVLSVVEMCALCAGEGGINWSKGFALIQLSLVA